MKYLACTIGVFIFALYIYQRKQRRDALRRWHDHESFAIYHPSDDPSKSRTEFHIRKRR